MRAGGRPPHSAVKRSRVVRMRGSSTTAPVASSMQTWVSCLCTSMPICSTAGLLVVAALTASISVGLRLPRARGGQPLHPIYLYKGAPRRRRTPRRGRPPGHVLGDGALVDVVTKFRELVRDAAAAPGGILLPTAR